MTSPLALYTSLAREALAVFLLLLCGVGLVVAGFMWCTPAGVAASALLSGAGGLALGMKR